MISNINFEKAIISTLLFDSRALHSIQEYISPSDFVDPMTHASLGVIETKVATGESINETILIHELPQYQDIIINDIVALPALDTKTLIDMAKQISNLAKRRRIIAVFSAAIEETKNGRPYDINELSSIEQGINTHTSNSEVIAVMEDRIKNKKVSSKTGIKELDSFLTTSPGDTIVIAARPSMGKTSLVSTLIWSFLDQNEGSLFLSLEMASDKIMSRMISSRCGEPVSNINRNAIVDYAAYQAAITELKVTDLFEISDLSMDENQIEHFVKQRIRANPKIKHVFIDHLTFTKDSGKHKNEHLRIGAITKAFKNLAKELGLRIWELSQLSRAIENRPNKRPQLSDLRESGSIEENADVVIGIYNESYYTAREAGEKQPSISPVELGVLKFRDGPTNTAHATFNGPLVRFESAGYAVEVVEYTSDEVPIAAYEEDSEDTDSLFPEYPSDVGMPVI